MKKKEPQRKLTVEALIHKISIIYNDGTGLAKQDDETTYYFVIFNLHEICTFSMYTLNYYVHTHNAVREISSESI